MTFHFTDFLVVLATSHCGQRHCCTPRLTCKLILRVLTFDVHLRLVAHIPAFDSCVKAELFESCLRLL